MINGQTVLAVIPARGGSKRCPRKNLRKFRGVSLILWSLEAAKQSQYLDRFVVSTEDEEIKVMAKLWGAEVIDRPAELASDQASNEDVLRHAMSLYPADLVVLLQPTSPLRIALDIDNCIEKVAASEVNDGCISYSEGNWQKNGAVYVARAHWIEGHDFSHAGTLKYWMPEERSLDIDHESDFDFEKDINASA